MHGSLTLGDPASPFRELALQSTTTSPRDIALAVAIFAAPCLVIACVWWLRRAHLRAQIERARLADARYHATRSLAQLNDVIHQVFNPGIDLTPMFEDVMATLGATDQATARLQTAATLRILNELHSDFVALADGRTDRHGSLALHKSDAPRHGYSAEVYASLDKSELAQALTQLEHNGFKVATLRRRISTARGHITRAVTARSRANHLTARDHLSAAQLVLREVSLTSLALPRRHESLEQCSLAFKVEAVGAAVALAPAIAAHKRLQRRYQPEVLTGVNARMATTREGLKSLNTLIARLDEHVEAGDLDLAEKVASALDAALYAIKTAHGAVRQCEATLLRCENDVAVESVNLLIALRQLEDRIKDRTGNQQRRSAAVRRLRARAHKAQIHAHRNPEAALREIRRIAASAAAQEQRSLTAHNTASTR